MVRVQSLLLLVGLTCLPGLVHAEGAESKPTVLGGSLAVALPTGEFGDATGIGFGGFMHLAHRLHPRVAVAATFGVLHHLEEAGTQLTEIPLLGGANLYLVEDKALFVFAQAGVSSLRSSVDVGIGDETETETKVGATLGAGVELGPGWVRAAIALPSVADMGDGFNLLAGYEIPVVTL
jgi:hypothetical protein